jgi:hypothetical protein
MPTNATSPVFCYAPRSLRGRRWPIERAPPASVRARRGVSACRLVGRLTCGPARQRNARVVCGRCRRGPTCQRRLAVGLVGEEMWRWVECPLQAQLGMFILFYFIFFSPFPNSNSNLNLNSISVTNLSPN